METQIAKMILITHRIRMGVSFNGKLEKQTQWNAFGVQNK